MKKVFENIKKSIFALAVSSVLFAGCSVGLGDAIDLTGPKVTVFSPDILENVSKNFKIEGEAVDNDEVAKLVVTCADYEWVLLNGKWGEGVSGTVEPIGKGAIKWSLDAKLPEDAQGEYAVKVIAYDNAGNTSRQSVVERTVVYDVDAPVVVVTAPAIIAGENTPIPTGYNATDYRNFTLLQNFLNEEIALQGYQDEAFNLKMLRVKLCGEDTNTVYYDSDEITEKEELRNWNVTVPASSLPEEKTFMQIITHSIDGAGNGENADYTRHGWICWWPQADKPWVELGKSGENSSSSEEYYLGSDFQCQAFDDDGIAKVEVEYFTGNDYTTLFGEKKVYNLEDSDEISTFYTWSEKLPGEIGNYKIVVKAIDSHGLESDVESGYITVLSTLTPKFTGFTASIPDGNYKTGDKIEILMKFNKAVKFTGGTPSITLNNGKTVEYTSGAETSTIVFEYTVEKGDDTGKLDITSINDDGIVWSDIFGEKVDSVDINSADVTKFADMKNISIVTEVPYLKSCAVSENGKELLLKFSTSIFKNVGKIDIAQKNVSAVPVVLSETEFRKLNAKNSSWSKYYSKTTNGCDEKGNADLTAKYVLNYEYDSSDATLINMYKAAGADKISLNVKSTAVSVAPADTLVLDISSGYALPCLGAEYSLSIPEGLVTDITGIECESKSDEFTLKGIEKPVVRVSKGASSFDTTALTATQPLTSAFKIDCETPNATVKYGISSRQYSYEYHDTTTDDYYEKSAARGYDDDVYASMDLGTGENGVATNSPLPKQGTAPSAPTSFDKAYSGEVSIGSSEWKFGEKFFIGAEATSGSSSEKAYATANRSLFVFKGGPDNDDQRIWLRGGDSETGDVLTAGFPLSWNMTDPNGVALLTNDDKYWYYISWEISTTAYVGVMIGEPEASGEKVIQKEGTTTFGVNAWVPFKAWYCIYPGESRIAETDRYEYVYGKQRDWFKWNWQSGSGGASQEEVDLAKMSIVATVAPADLNDDGVTQTVSCTDEWQRLCVEKWAGDTGTNGSYLVFDVSMATGDEHYIDVWWYSWGNKQKFETFTVTKSGTAKILISNDDSDGWKYNNIYIGGKGVTINSVKRYKPTSSTVPVPNASMLTAGAKIKVTTNAEVDSIVDNPGFSAGKQWQNAAKNTTYTITLTQEDVDSLKGWGYISSLGIGIDKVETPVTTYTIPDGKLTGVQKGDTVVVTFSTIADSGVSSPVVYTKVHSWDSWEPHAATGSSTSFIYGDALEKDLVGYGVEITNVSYKSPFTTYDASTALDGVKNGDTVIITFTKLAGFDIAEPTISTRANGWSSWVPHTATGSSIEFTYDGFDKTSLSGYGVTITDVTYKSPYHYFNWEALTDADAKEGVMIELKISSTKDDFIGENPCKLTFFGEEFTVTPGQTFTYTIENNDSKLYDMKQNQSQKVCGYGVTVESRTVKNPYTELTLSNPNNLGYGASCKITVTFEKLSGFDGLESTLTYYNWGLVDSVILTADDISSGTYTFTGITMQGYTKVIGCGVKILTAEIQNP